MKLALALLVCSVAVAAAEPAAKSRAAAAYAEGEQRYNAGEYPIAATKFLEAYASDPDPAYLFNVAQAFRFAHDCAQAARYYRQFLAEVTSAPNLDKVRGYLADMDACVRRSPPASPITQVHLPPPPLAPADPTPPPITPPVAATPAPADPGATRRHLGLALGGVGVVALGAGAWFHHDVGYFEDKTHGCTPAAPCTAAQVAHDQDKGHTASSLAIASYTVGGAALVGGAVLYLLGRGPSEQPVAIAPARGGAVVTAGFAF